MFYLIRLKICCHKNIMRITLKLIFHGFVDLVSVSSKAQETNVILLAYYILEVHRFMFLSVVVREHILQWEYL